MRWAELVALFLGVPLIFYFAPTTLPKIPFLLAVLLFCVAALRRDSSFDRTLFWNANALARELPGIAGRTALVAAALVTYVALTEPSMLFWFPRQHPLIWLVVMILYPVLSAYPQELIYRTFFFHRYAVILPTAGMRVALSTVAFSVLHLMYDNTFAVVATMVGGLAFSLRYARTRSLAAVSLEHALYGCLVFTVGLGRFFYEGR